jgi:hypothetical protein
MIAKLFVLFALFAAVAGKCAPSNEKHIHMSVFERPADGQRWMQWVLCTDNLASCTISS